jgi:hypothetical protein
MEITNLKGLPAAIVEAVRNDDYDSGASDLTASKLIDSPRLVALVKKHHHEIVDDAENRIWALLGKGVHYVLERAEPSELTELRLFTTINGWRVSGAFDRLSLKHGKLIDYKVTSAWTVVYGDRLPDWEAQLNVLAELVARNSDREEVRELAIVAILRDWSKTRAREGGDYPPVQIVEIPIRLWGLETRRAYLEQRVALHQRAQAGELPECSDEERWAKPTTYALMKGQNKRAVKIHETREAAEEHRISMGGDMNYWIEERPGQNVRCEDYCPVVRFCEQARALGVKAVSKEAA